MLLCCPSYRKEHCVAEIHLDVSVNRAVEESWLLVKVDGNRWQSPIHFKPPKQFSKAEEDENNGQKQSQTRANR